MNLLLCLSFIFVCFIVLIAGLIVASKKNWNLDPFLAISSGGLFVIAFIDFLPKIFSENLSYGESSNNSYGEILHYHSFEIFGALILIGILVQGIFDLYFLKHLKFLDKLIKNPDEKDLNCDKPDHFDCIHETQQHSHSHILSPVSSCSIIGCLIICSLFDGIRFFTAISLEQDIGIQMTLALFFHRLSEGIIVINLSLKAGLKKKSIFFLLFCFFGASFFIGSLITSELLANIDIRFVIAFSTGILFYICFIHLIPFCFKTKNQKYFFMGIILFSLNDLFLHFIQH